MAGPGKGNYNVIRDFLRRHGVPVRRAFRLLLLALAGFGQTAAAGPALRFVAIGDFGTGEAGQYRVAAAIEQVCAARGCDFALGLGDNIYEEGVGSAYDVQFENKFERPYAHLDFPFYMALGNHDNTRLAAGDGGDNGDGDYQVAYSYRAARASDKWRMPARQYHFSAGEQVGGRPLADFFALDSNPLTAINPDPNPHFSYTTYGSEQFQWVQEALHASSGRWKIAFAHHPYISNGQHGNAGHYDSDAGILSEQASGRYYKGFLEQSVCDKVDVLISGHDHDLEWLKPVSDCGKTFFIVSGAGAKTRSFGDAARNASYWQADATLGFFWIELDGDRFTAAAYTVDPLTGAPTQAFEKSLQRTP